MIKTRKPRTRLAKSHRKRMAAARRDLDKIQKRIAPYLKKKPLPDNPPAGEWCETSLLHLCEPDKKQQ